MTEIVIAMAMLSVVALAFSQLIFQQGLVAKQASSKQNFGQVVQALSSSAAEVTTVLRTEALTEDPSWQEDVP